MQGQQNIESVHTLTNNGTDIVMLSWSLVCMEFLQCLAAFTQWVATTTRLVLPIRLSIQCNVTHTRQRAQRACHLRPRCIGTVSSRTQSQSITKANVCKIPDFIFITVYFCKWVHVLCEACTVLPLLPSSTCVAMISEMFYRISRDNLVNKANLVHNLFSVYLSISTCFGRLRARHQEKQLCFQHLVLVILCG